MLFLLIPTATEMSRSARFAQSGASAEDQDLGVAVERRASCRRGEVDLDRFRVLH